MSEILVNQSVINGVDVTRSSGAPFTPASISGIVAWFRADLGITLNGSNISAWADQSGNGNNLSQGTAAKQPPQPATNASYNNQLVFSTNATTFLSLATLTLAQPFTILFVGKSTTTSGSAITTSTSAFNDPLILNSAGNDMDIFAGAHVTTASLATSPCAMWAEFNSPGGATTSRAAVNNWLSGGTTGNVGTNNGVALGIGAYTGGDFGSACDFAEIAIWSRVLTALEQTQMASYVTGRYGFTIT